MTDKKILWELDADCRVSYETLARKIGISSNSIRRRVEKMRELGKIEQFIVQLTPEMLGGEFLVALIHTDGSEIESELITKIGNNPMVLQVSSVASGTGGVYTVFAQYIGSKGLAELSVFLRSHSPVCNVEMHPILSNRGKRVNLTPTQLKVLRCLMQNARMTVVEIRERTGMSTKKIRRTLEQLRKSGGIHFGVRWDLCTGGDTEVQVRINWDETAATYNEVVQWLKDEYPLEFWAPNISASEPVIFASFILRNLQEIEPILRKIREAPFVKTASTLVCYSSSRFSWIGELKLEEMLTSAGL
ncbi:MAG: winged helix-turn-helix transcriptional regulator [Candidatus Thorarchaeota archaeon]